MGNIVKLPKKNATHGQYDIGDFCDTNLLRVSPKGQYTNCLYNIKQILTSGFWEDTLRFNSFTQRVEMTDGVPINRQKSIQITDIDITNIIIWFAEYINMTVSEGDVYRVIDSIAAENSYHPVRDYLKSLTWDGDERIPAFFPIIFGAKDTPATRIFAKDFLVGSVARIMDPGCKNDDVLILQGSQGILKSTSLRVLFGKDYFCDTPFDFGSQNGYLTMIGNWCIEIAELSQFRRADALKAKAFFSQRTDEYRKPWGRNTVIVPRSCVFVGTTNQMKFLDDPTGNRRYMPIIVPKIHLDILEEERDQIWAEAMVKYEDCIKTGEGWWFDSRNADVCSVQNQHFDEDAWEDLILKYVVEFDVSVIHTQTIVDEVLKLESSQITNFAKTRIRSIMEHIGWKPGNYRIGNHQLRGYKRTEKYDHSAYVEHESADPTLSKYGEGSPQSWK